jgi:hypothetical protein
VIVALALLGAACGTDKPAGPTSTSASSTTVVYTTVTSTSR